MIFFEPGRSIHRYVAWVWWKFDGLWSEYPPELHPGVAWSLVILIKPCLSVLISYHCHIGVADTHTRYWHHAGRTDRGTLTRDDVRTYFELASRPNFTKYIYWNILLTIYAELYVHSSVIYTPTVQVMTWCRQTDDARSHGNSNHGMVSAILSIQYWF